MNRSDYAAIAVLSPITGRWELMSSGECVIVFDTARLAWEWLPMVGQGRRYAADSRTMRLSFQEVAARLPSQARVVCPYRPDEYGVWKRHVMWSEWWTGCGQPTETLSARELVANRMQDSAASVAFPCDAAPPTAQTRSCERYQPPHG